MSGNWNFFDPIKDPLIVGLEPELISMLDMARGKAGYPFIITSGLRSPAQNANCVGSAQHSAHLPDGNNLSQAVDLAVTDGHSLFAILEGLHMAGFRRLGLYFIVSPDNPQLLIPRHVHADIANDPLHPQDDIWCQMEQNG